MRRSWEHMRRRFMGTARIFAGAMAALLIIGCMLGLATAYDYVTITDDAGTAHTLLTTSREPDEILAAAGVATSPNDRVQYTHVSANTASIAIERAFPVHLVADGKTVTEEFLAGTVADMVAASGVQLGPDDFFEPAADLPLQRGLTITVNRVRYVQELRRETLDEATVAAYKNSMEDPEAFVESHDGSYDVTYRDRLVNGKIESSEIIDLAPLVTFLKPRPLDSFTLEPGVPCSRIEGFEDIKVGPDGIPLNYTGVWQSAVCTAYSASRGRGSSGLGLYCGTVAVNPNRIPYGSRMFITSADGSFIYGFAIATDTGTAMMDGYVDIDLFFETNAECRSFGKRSMVVYFLD